MYLSISVRLSLYLCACLAHYGANYTSWSSLQIQRTNHTPHNTNKTIDVLGGSRKVLIFGSTST